MSILPVKFYEFNFDQVQNFEFSMELILEANQAMFTLRDPRYVSYNDYVDRSLYLRWYVVSLLNSDDRHSWYTEDGESILQIWLLDNCKGRFSSRSWSHVCFENRHDAMLFKLAFA